MKQKKFEQQAREAAKAMLKKKAPTKPDTQFVKGAMWAWELLMDAKGNGPTWRGGYARE